MSFLQAEPASSRARRNFYYLISAWCWPCFPPQYLSFFKNKWSVGAHKQKFGDKFNEIMFFTQHHLPRFYCCCHLAIYGMKHHLFKTQKCSVGPARTAGPHFVPSQDFIRESNSCVHKLAQNRCPAQCQKLVANAYCQVCQNACIPGFRCKRAR